MSFVSALQDVSKVVGRAWEDGDEVVNFVNMVVGLKTNEMTNLMRAYQEDFNCLKASVERIEAVLGERNSGDDVLVAN
ncbi:MAG: hypothetical protein OEM26_01860 [Saprospiraceae bacterium]|nr:hypothetical protein [Saprospiraceae bacterium]